MAKNDSNPAEANVADNAPDGVALTDAQVQNARTEGAKQDVQDVAKDVHRAMTDGALPGEPVDFRWHGHDEIQQYAWILDLGVKDFEARVSADASDPASIPDVKVYGLLALERNGQNRTPYVKAMMKRLDLKAEDLPGGGPAYTNDLTSITDL